MDFEVTLITHRDNETFPTICPFTLAAYIYLKANRCIVHCREPSASEVDRAPFFKFGDDEVKEDNFEKLVGHQDILNILQVHNFDADVKNYEHVMEHLIPLRHAVFFIYYETYIPDKVDDLHQILDPNTTRSDLYAKLMGQATRCLEALSNLLGDKHYLLLERGSTPTTAIEMVLFSSIILIIKKLDGSDLHKKVMKYSNLRLVAERIYVCYIKGRRDLVNFSRVDNVKFEEFLERYLTTTHGSKLLLCNFPEDNYLNLPCGRYVVKIYSMTRESHYRYGTPGYNSEVESVRCFPTEHFAELIGCAKNRNLNCIVLKYYEQGDLAAITKVPHLSWRETLDILIQVSYILYVFHYEPCGPEDKWVYGDFKPENFLRENGRIFLCDLESMAYENEELTSWTMPYIDPANKGKMQQSSDIYKCGLFMVHLITTQVIEYPGCRPVPNLYEILKNRFENEGVNSLIRPRLLESGCEGEVTNKILKLVFSCVDIEPCNRPSARTLIDTLRVIEDI